MAAPVADFTGVPLTGITSTSVVFTDTSTNTPTSRAWNFGDSHQSTLQNPTHVYNTAGVFTVTLVATNIDGTDAEVKVAYITIHVPNIYNIPVNIWNNMTDVERRLFNYYFLGGPQNKDIFYTEGLQSNIAIAPHYTAHNHNPALYTPRVALHAYSALDLVNYDGQDYIVVIPHTSTSTFDITKFSADNADMTDADYKNIKSSYLFVSIPQNPVLGLVVTDPLTGVLINTDISNYKAMTDILYMDLIKQMYHRVKTVTSFNI